MMIREEETKTKTKKTKRRRDRARTTTRKKTNETKQSLKKLSSSSSSLSLSLFILIGLFLLRRCIFVQRDFWRFFCLGSSTLISVHFVLSFLFLSSWRISFFCVSRQILYKVVRLQQSRAGESFQRETDTHTHTHTHRERERESVCVCVCEKIR